MRFFGKHKCNCRIVVCSAEYDIRTGIFNSNIGISMTGFSHSTAKRTSKSMPVENYEFINYINDETRMVILL